MSNPTIEYITLRGQSAWAGWLRSLACTSGYGVPRLIEQALREYATARKLTGPPPRLPNRIKARRVRTRYRKASSHRAS
jgi:hypothetical protein